MSFLRYTLRRVALSAFAAFLVVSLTFVVVAVNRFQPVSTPLTEQYVNYMTGIATFDWGYSESMRRPVGDVLAAAIPRTLAYVVPAILFTYTLGIVAGLAAAYGTSTRDSSIRMFAYVLLGVPTMVLGAVVAFQLAGHFSWLSDPIWCTESGVEKRCWPPFVRRSTPFFDPVRWGPRPDQGWPNTVPWRNIGAKYLLPAAVLSVGLATGLFRHARNHALVHRQSATAKMLRAKGASTLVDARHALRNAALPLLSVSFAELMSVIALWAFVVEAIFHVPGITAYAQVAVRMRDLPLLVGTTTVLALFGVGFSLLQDLLYGYLDPRLGE